MCLFKASSYPCDLLEFHLICSLQRIMSGFWWRIDIWGFFSVSIFSVIDSSIPKYITYLLWFKFGNNLIELFWCLYYLTYNICLQRKPTEIEYNFNYHFHQPKSGFLKFKIYVLADYVMRRCTMIRVPEGTLPEFTTHTKLNYYKHRKRILSFLKVCVRNWT